MSRLRIASYNTRDFLDDRYAAARVVRSIAPDVICFQEVPRRLFARRKVAAFARDCGLVWPATHRGSGGTTIMTAPWVPLRFAAHVRLHTALIDRTRGYAVAQVGRAEHSLTIVSVHLSLKAAERVRHTRQILAGVAAAQGEAVIAGDLNESEGGDAYGLLASPMRVISPQRPTFSSRNPRHMLDLIFATPGVSVLAHEDVALDTRDLQAASDHLPTWVDVDVPWGQPAVPVRSTR